MNSRKNVRIIAFIFLFILVLIWVLPLIWAVLTSFKSQDEIQSAGSSFLPLHWTLANYKDLLSNNDSSPILKWFLNSVIVAVSQMAIVIVVVATAAYGYGRLKFKGRDLMFTLLLASMMFPSVVNLISLYQVINTIGWVNNLLAVIVPGTCGVFNLFLVRQFVLGIPKALDESAKIDGANEFQIFSRVVLPLIKPVLTVVALFSFTGAWNDFLWPSIIISDIDKLPITPGLQLLQGQYMTYPGIGTAGAIIALLPALLLYLFAQKYFMQSMSLSSGVKG